MGVISTAAVKHCTMGLYLVLWFKRELKKSDSNAQNVHLTSVILPL